MNVSVRVWGAFHVKKYYLFHCNTMVLSHHIQTKLARKAHVIPVISLFVLGRSLYDSFLRVVSFSLSFALHSPENDLNHAAPIDKHTNRIHRRTNFAPNSKLILPIFLESPRQPAFTFHNITISPATSSRRTNTNQRRNKKEKKTLLYVSIKRRPPHAARHTK